MNGKKIREIITILTILVLFSSLLTATAIAKDNEAGGPDNPFADSYSGGDLGVPAPEQAIITHLGGDLGAPAPEQAIITHLGGHLGVPLPVDNTIMSIDDGDPDDYDKAAPDHPKISLTDEGDPDDYWE